MNLGTAGEIGIELRDPLAEVLGAAREGERLRFAYGDVAKAAGHSCPTVVGAFLMVKAALQALYGEDTPVRGELDVTVGAHPEEGNSGAIAQVITHITGAATNLGFAGLGGKFSRRRLLRFDPSLKGDVRFERTDTGAAVRVRYDASRVPAPPEMGALMKRVLDGSASAAERSRFGELWQARCADILTGEIGRVVTVVPELAS